MRGGAQVVYGNNNWARKHFRGAIAMLHRTRDKYPFHKIVSHQFPLEQINEAFAQQHTGHVTPAARARAVDYMQQTLREHGVHEPFFAWNDHTQRTFPQVKAMICESINSARKNGE